MNVRHYRRLQGSWKECISIFSRGGRVKQCGFIVWCELWCGHPPLCLVAWGDGIKVLLDVSTVFQSLTCSNTWAFATVHLEGCNNQSFCLFQAHFLVALFPCRHFIIGLRVAEHSWLRVSMSELETSRKVGLNMTCIRVLVINRQVPEMFRTSFVQRASIPLSMSGLWQLLKNSTGDYYSLRYILERKVQLFKEGEFQRKNNQQCK